MPPTSKIRVGRRLKIGRNCSEIMPFLLISAVYVISHLLLISMPIIFSLSNTSSEVQNKFIDHCVRASVLNKNKTENENNSEVRLSHMERTKSYVGDYCNISRFAHFQCTDLLYDCESVNFRQRDKLTTHSYHVDDSEVSRKIHV